MESESVAELVREICQLVRGPARPVLEKAAQKWLEGFNQACADAPRLLEVVWPRRGKDRERIEQHNRKRESQFPRIPYPLDEREPEFERYTANLAVFHDVNCSRCRRKPLFPEPKDDQYGGMFWAMLRDAVRTKPDPSFIRECLDFVGSELQNRGVLPSGEDESGTSTPLAKGRSEGKAAKTRKPKPDKPLTPREKRRKQRLDFCRKRAHKQTWDDIYAAYRKKYPKDTKASPATLRLMFERHEGKYSDK